MNLNKFFKKDREQNLDFTSNWMLLPTGLPLALPSGKGTGLDPSPCSNRCYGISDTQSDGMSLKVWAKLGFGQIKFFPAALLSPHDQTMQLDAVLLLHFLS